MEEKYNDIQGQEQIQEGDTSVRYIKLPTIALRGNMLFPYTVGVFDIGRVPSLNALAKATEGDMLLFISQQKKLEKENVTVKDLNKIGVIVKLRLVPKAINDCVRVSVQALCEKIILPKRHILESFKRNLAIIYKLTIEYLKMHLRVCNKSPMLKSFYIVQQV